VSGATARNDSSGSVIKGAGLAVRKTPVRKPHVFAIKQGAVSGSVKVSTVSAKTSLSGLAVGSTVMFRYRTVTKAGVSDWVAPVSFFVN